MLVLLCWLFYGCLSAFELEPGQYMLVDAVDECAVGIEEESRAMRRMLSHGYEILPLDKSYRKKWALLRWMP